MLTTAFMRFAFPARQGARRMALGLVDAVLQWQDRANQRHRLSGLSDAALKDIGLTRADVECEASKPFWVR